MLSLVTGLVSVAVPAAADGPNHAAVIIETGSQVHRVVVSFDGDSISGLEALALVPGANPSTLGFSGLGGGVCALFGVGHPATSSTCLGEPSDVRYWAYWHVPAGQSGFSETTYSRAGASSVRVHDGDTQGWRYGTGEAPAWVQLEFPAPAPPATAAPAADEPAPSLTGPGGSAGGDMGLPSKGSTTTTLAPTPEQAAAAAAAAAADGRRERIVDDVEHPGRGDHRGRGRTGERESRCRRRRRESAAVDPRVRRGDGDPRRGHLLRPTGPNREPAVGPVA